ncbi:hypothetical protein [Streptomyces sp. NPDC086782]|uniref:hypothetical protein n=1 Tax=Streptomyces sp. NPDC086782 TaxID=3365757 RepID=UPI003805EAFF
MFTEIYTRENEQDSRGTATECLALSLLRRGCNRGYAIEATRDGGAVITWRRTDRIARRKVQCSITLAPHTPVGDLTAQTLQDLTLVDSVKVARYVRSIGHRDGDRVIEGGTYVIPPARTDALGAYGLIVADSGGRLRLTLTAHLARLAQAHATLLDPAAPAVTCMCGYTAHAKSADQADQLLHSHRAAVGADFVGSLTDAFTAAVAATD